MAGVNNVNFKMDYNKYTKEELVTLCNTYKSKIDYLESIKNHVDLHNVSQQREMLIDFMGKLTVDDHEGTIQDTVDRYLKSINL